MYFFLLCPVVGDDEDDIMFVEDRDPLIDDEMEQFIHEETIEEQFEFVASEIVVEEIVEHTTDDGVTHNDASNDSQIEEDSTNSTDDDNLYERSIENIEVDVEEHVPATKLNYSKEAMNGESETISLSDSLSCFDSDAEQEVIEMDDMEFHSENKNKAENLNESTDDVILMHDSRDDPIDDDSSCIPNENDNNQTTSTANAAIEDNNDSQEQLEDNLTTSLNENATDYDDDSSTSQDRRARRSRGDRIDYSYRQSYESCRAVANSNNEMKEGNTQSEADNSLSQNTLQMPESQNTELIADQRNQDKQLDIHKENADDETQMEFMFKQNTSIRTYQRRKKMSSVKPLLDDHQGDDSTSKDIIDSETIDRTELTSLELAEAAVHTDEINIKLNTEIGTISESDSNSQIEVEVLRKKRSVGRPRKQRANAISDRSESEQENQEQMSQPSLLPPPVIDEIKLLVETTSEIVEQTKLETLSTPNDSLPMDASVSTNSSVLFAESDIKDIKDETEVPETQASPSQSGVENIIETSPVNTVPVQDLSFEVMEVNGKYFDYYYIHFFCTITILQQFNHLIEPSGENSVEEVENGMQKIEINAEQQPDEITEIDDLFDTSLEMQIDAKSESDKLISVNETLAYDDQMNAELCDDVQILDFKSVELKDEEQITKTENEVLSALNESPKNLQNENDDDTTSTRRRSGRIKTINKTKQRVQGLGLVKDKRRTLNVDDDLSNTSIEMLNDLAGDKELGQIIETMARVKTEEELDQERIDRENGMKLFIQIIDNEYRSERTISKEAKKMTCDCFLTQHEIERRELGCGDDCLNRMLLIECGPKCVVGDRCTNKRFQKHENSDCTIFKTEKKGYGLIASSYIPAGTFIMEYVGEVLNSKQFEKRANDYSKLMNAHYYFMALSSDCVIDATKKGNISRFINHSCDPNAETQKWTVNGELRIGFFSKKPIMPYDEVTFDYQFQRYG